MNKSQKHNALFGAVALPLWLWTAAVAADPAPATEPAKAATEAAGTTIELNKLEPTDKGCRAYMVVNNQADKNFQSFKIDLVVFQPDGVIGRRLLVDFAPLKAQKKSVRLFEIEGVPCDKIGSLLINDVTECKADSAVIPGCLDNLKTSSLTKVQLSK